MNRTIKFQAYHPVHGWADDFHIGKAGLEVVFLKKPNEFFYEQVTGKTALSEWTLREFTGLLDKNRKEIFEGDITKVTLKGSFVGIVVFHNGAFMFDTRRPYIAPYILVSDWAEKFKRTVEVIGNVFDNPELIEKYVVKP